MVGADRRGGGGFLVGEEPVGEREAWRGMVGRERHGEGAWDIVEEEGETWEGVRNGGGGAGREF